MTSASGVQPPITPPAFLVLADQNTPNIYRLELTAGPAMTNADFWAHSDLMDQIQGQMDTRDLETRYGVHDCGGLISGTVLLEYSSYEIGVDDPSDWDRLQAEWAEIMTAVGYTVGGWTVTQDPDWQPLEDEDEDEE